MNTRHIDCGEQVARRGRRALYLATYDILLQLPGTHTTKASDVLLVIARSRYTQAQHRWIFHRLTTPSPRPRFSHDIPPPAPNSQEIRCLRPLLPLPLGPIPLPLTPPSPPRRTPPPIRARIPPCRPSWRRGSRPTVASVSSASARR